MEILSIIRKDLTEKDGCLAYDKDLNFDGHIHIEGHLGLVRFAFGVAATGRIWAQAGSGIEAGSGIKAGSGIEAGWGIKAGSGIEAGEGIVSLRGGIRAKLVSCLRVAAGFDVSEKCTIEAEVEKGEVVLGEVRPPNPLPPVEYAWHVHHNELVERLTEPIENRISYIKSNKVPEEVPTRLRLLKKVQDVKALRRAMAQGQEAVEELHRKECKDCPWDGWTIFPEGRA